ncbi:MAG: exosome complex protein Rrp42 [Candidatus Bathyarchaeia archaeon]
MRFSRFITNVERKQMLNLLSTGKRIDGRDFYTYREIKIETGIVDHAEGSARVHLGDTDVLVGVKIDVGEPFPDIPNEGVLTVNAELVPLASPAFEPGPPDENSIELARVVDRGIRESRAIEVEKLCIIPGKKVFVVFVDIYVLNHGGNLIDASALASLAALLNTKMHNYELVEGEIKMLAEYQPLPLRNYPIAITFGKVSNYLILDPSFEEEQIMETRLTITMDKDRRICAVQKGVGGSFTFQQVMDMIKVASEKSEELRKKVLGVCG